MRYLIASGDSTLPPLPAKYLHQNTFKFTLKPAMVEVVEISEIFSKCPLNTVEVPWCSTTNMLGIEERGSFRRQLKSSRDLLSMQLYVCDRKRGCRETARFDIITHPQAGEATAEQEQLQSWKYQNDEMNQIVNKILFPNDNRN
jgi:hypothetical protein